MCGIFGSFNYDIYDKEDILLKSLNKRGPDGNGVFRDFSTKTFLLHTRLSIIDVTTESNQPFQFKNLIIVFNGEIYNYQELKSELITLGYEFKTNSDTEVVLISYFAWKEKCLIKFRGMFAFGIYNTLDNSFFGARDFFGIKPFYIYKKDEVFMFSSLIITLLKTGAIAKKLNHNGLSIFLQTGSFTQEETIIDQIKQLPPAHYIQIKGKDFSIHKYWDIRNEDADLYKSKNYEDAKNLLRKKLEESAKYQLISDVPVGAFLSSGIDSTIVVGLMSKFSSNKLDTFTVGFENKYSKLNELEGARITSKKFDTNHHEIIIKDNTINQHINDYIISIDQPSMDGFNTYFVAKETSNYTKVAVSGLGADELFAGYSHFVYASFANKILRNGTQLNFNFFDNLHIPSKYKEILNYIFSNPIGRNKKIRNYSYQNTMINKLNTIDDYIFDDVLNNYFNLYDLKLDSIQQLSYWEINKYLLNTLLRDGDALSMSQSLEVRPLFLDHKLASYVFNLPGDYKIRYTSKKKILIDSCKDLLSDEILSRKKTGFELPLSQWLMTELKAEFKEILLSDLCKKLFKDDYRLYLLSSLENGEIKNTHWSIYVLFKYIIINEIDIF